MQNKMRETMSGHNTKRHSLQMTAGAKWKLQQGVEYTKQRHSIAGAAIACTSLHRGDPCPPPSVRAPHLEVERAEQLLC